MSEQGLDFTSTAERSSYCWLVPCTISNALRWQWIPRIGVFHKDISSLEYFLRSLSNFIHPPHRSHSTRLSTICSRDYHTVLRPNLTYSLKASTPCCHRAEELVRRLHIDPGIQSTVESSDLFTSDHRLQYILGDSSEHLVIILCHSVYVLRNINWDSGLQTVYIERIPAVNERFWNGQNSLYPSHISLRTFTAADMEKN